MNLKLFWTFFKIGLFTFGGGYAMISHINEEIVNKHKWITEEELLEIVAIAESTPGPIAINMATFVGYKQNKFFGSLFSTLGVILPSLIIIFTISLFLDNFLSNKYVQYAFEGIKCCVAFLILKAGLSLLKKSQKSIFSLTTTGFVIASMIVLELTSTSFSSIDLILIGALLGIIIHPLLSKEKEVNDQ